jgi:hypothetical protein
MGASLLVNEYRGTEKQVLARWNSDVEDSEYENGHAGNYTGKNGIVLWQFDTTLMEE